MARFSSLVCCLIFQDSLVLQFFFLLMSLSGFYVMIMLDLGKSTLENFSAQCFFVGKPSGLTVFSLRKLKIMYSGNSVVQWSQIGAFTAMGQGFDCW